MVGNERDRLGLGLVDANYYMWNGFKFLMCFLMCLLKLKESFSFSILLLLCFPISLFIFAYWNITYPFLVSNFSDTYGCLSEFHYQSNSHPLKKKMFGLIFFSFCFFFALTVYCLSVTWLKEYLFFMYVPQDLICSISFSENSCLHSSWENPKPLCHQPLLVPRFL